MKYFKILPVLLLSSFFLINSCKDETKTAKEDKTTSTEVTEPVAAQPNVVTPKTTEPAQNASGVWHYTCRLGCPGGGGSATKCTNCGNVLAHNTTYHGNADNSATTPFAVPAANTATTPASTKAPEPAQNALGVWHYTCSKGCAGGAGSAGTCGTCNGALAHNAAYH